MNKLSRDDRRAILAAAASTISLIAELEERAHGSVRSDILAACQSRLDRGQTLHFSAEDICHAYREYITC